LLTVTEPATDRGAAHLAKARHLTDGPFDLLPLAQEPRPEPLATKAAQGLRDGGPRRELGRYRLEGLGHPQALGALRPPLPPRARLALEVLDQEGGLVSAHRRPGLDLEGRGSNRLAGRRRVLVPATHAGG